MSYKVITPDTQIYFGGCPHVAVVCGWTLVDKLFPKLQYEDYCTVGNLYSPNLGIDYLIRNLLANPQIKIVLALAATPFDTDKTVGAITALTDFFKFGVQAGIKQNKPIWNIISQVDEAFIGGDIAIADLEKLRTDIVYCIYTNIDELVKECKYLSQTTPNNTRKAVLYPPSVNDTVTKFGEDYAGSRVAGDSIADVWVKILQRVLTTGKEYPTRFGTTMHEVVDLVSVVNKYDSGFPDFFPTSHEAVKRYQDEIVASPSPDTIITSKVAYTYGDRIRQYFGVDQLTEVASCLAQFPDARNAVINLWDTKYDPLITQPPCLNHVWFRLRDGQVNVTATFRSNDMYSAWVQNAYGILALMDFVIDHLIKLKPDQPVSRGKLIIISQSAHIYSDRIPAAQDIVKDYFIKRSWAETMDFSDPVGNFLIYLENNQIKVTHLTRAGQVVKVFHHKNPVILTKHVVLSCPTLEVTHAAYLGGEIMKAYGCLQKGEPYKQDVI
jgi:thymidylate synthase